MPMYRDALEELIKEQSTKQGLSIDTAFSLYKKVNHFLDYAIHAFSYTFVAHHIKALELAKQEMQEISVPVVPIKKESLSFLLLVIWMMNVQSTCKAKH